MVSSSSCKSWRLNGGRSLGGDAGVTSGNPSWSQLILDSCASMAEPESTQRIEAEGLPGFRVSSVVQRPAPREHFHHGPDLVQDSRPPEERHIFLVQRGKPMSCGLHDTMSPEQVSVRHPWSKWTLIRVFNLKNHWARTGFPSANDIGKIVVLSIDVTDGCLALEMLTQLFH